MSGEMIDRVIQIIDPLLMSEGMERANLEYRRESRGWILRLYIDKEGGVTIDDCSRISRELGRILDVENPIDFPYTLEVSSPGLTRPLKTARDFEKYRNRVVKVKTLEPIENERRFRGRLLRTANEGIEIEVAGKAVHIPFEAIAKANLEVEF